MGRLSPQFPNLDVADTLERERRVSESGRVCVSLRVWAGNFEHRVACRRLVNGISALRCQLTDANRSDRIVSLAEPAVGDTFMIITDCPRHNIAGQQACVRRWTSGRAEGIMVLKKERCHILNNLGVPAKCILKDMS